MQESVQGYHSTEHITIEDLNTKGPFPAGEPNTAYARYFVGKSYLTAISTSQVPIYAVSFEAGCRNNWHTHKASRGGGQILIVTAGRGYYQAWGEEPLELHPGDVVHIPANVKHWHGAAPNTAFQHLAVEVPGENNSTEWAEPVSAEDYARLK